MKNQFNCLICCASTSGGFVSDEFEKYVLFDFLCGMLNVDLTEEYSWDFSRDHFPLCLRCCCVIRDMFQIQMLADSVELSVIEKAEKMKQTIFDCVQLKRKQLLKTTSTTRKTVTDTDPDDFQEDPRFEFFRNQVIQKNCEQLTNTLKISVAVPTTTCSSDSTGALLTSNCDHLLTNNINAPENEENIDLTGQVLGSFSERLSKSTEESSLDFCSSSETDTDKINDDIPLPDSDTLDFQWPSWEDWEDFSLPLVNEKANKEINTTSEDDALYQALINEKCNVDIGPLLDKANLSSCSVTYDANFVSPTSAADDDTDDAPENSLNPSSNDSCEVITISDDSQDSDDDYCTIIEPNNNGKERTRNSRNSKKSSKYSKSKGTNEDKVHIVLTTHSIVTDKNNPEVNTDIIIEQKTPIQVRSGIFMAVNGAQDTWQCILCGKIVRNFKNHKAVHYPGKFHCNLCQAVFKRKDNLLAHHKTKH